jgi:hypothetical protein
MRKMNKSLLFLLCLLNTIAYTQTINIGLSNSIDSHLISPWIYGRNGSISDNPSSPVSAANWQLYKDAGLRMYRENGGNNCTKYNWRKKLSSHPDWYNNVYSHDWDFSASSLLQNTVNTQGFYGFQLIGWAASNKNNNFNDWAYNKGAYWSGTSNNWAGGGNPGNGNPNLYLESWPADSSAGILKNWFSTLKLDSTRLRYWNMDNEPEIWSGTHDDVVNASAPVSAEQFVQKYLTVAKAARKAFPGIKLVGPVSPNEWQFYTWNSSKVLASDGKSYPWMEYFIKRIAEEQKATGLRLLDVLDVHFYPATQSNPDLALQIHRFWFDTTWVYPNANGVKVVGPNGWNASVNKEYFFGRCQQWLTQYMGSGHQVHFGVSEYGTVATSGSEDPNIIACWYASHLGTFANNNIELFTPWDWYKGQWEVLHLFSTYFGKWSAQATSDQESILAAYSSLSKNKDTLVVILVNKDRINPRTLDINLSNYKTTATTLNGYQLANLPTTETFISAGNNALAKKQFSLSNNHLSFTVPKLSVTLVQVPLSGIVASFNSALIPEQPIKIYPSHTSGKVIIESENLAPMTITILDIAGRQMENWTELSKGEININNLPAGIYIIQVVQNNKLITRKLVKE